MYVPELWVLEHPSNLLLHHPDRDISSEADYTHNRRIPHCQRDAFDILESFIFPQFYHHHSVVYETINDLITQFLKLLFLGFLQEFNQLMPVWRPVLELSKRILYLAYLIISNPTSTIFFLIYKKLVSTCASRCISSPRSWLPEAFASAMSA